MRHDPPLIPATLIRRYKRFLADVRLPTGEMLTVHTPNTGRMLGLTTPGSRIWLKDSHNPARKYRYSWVMASSEAGTPVSVDTHLANALVIEAIENGTLAELQGYSRLRTEVRYGEENSRIDILLEEGDARCYVEVKNVTALVDGGQAIFPDAVSARGSRHLRELMAMKRQGARAVLVFAVMREDARGFAPADDIDPDYGRHLREALAAGVEVLAYRARITPGELRLTMRLPVSPSL